MKFTQNNYQRHIVPERSFASFRTAVCALGGKAENDISDDDMETLIKVIAIALANYEEIKGR